MARFSLSILREIGEDVERSFSVLNSLWEEEDISVEEKSKRVEKIRQELLVFCQEKISEEKLNLIKCKIQGVRDEIKIWWEKCFLSERERHEFADYRSTEYSDKLYLSHVNELGILKRRFSRHEMLFALIEKYQETWKRVVNVDKQLYNPERLFQNRGAQLLQEEKDRRAAQKDLPQLEDNIKKEATLYEREHGRPFLVYGRRFSDMIVSQKEQHKENLKSLRSAKKCDNNVDSGNLPKTTSLSKLKRKMETNSPITNCKQAKMASDKYHLTSKPAKTFQRKLNLPVRRKLINGVNIPVLQP